MTDRELLEAAAKAAGYELETEPASVWVVGEDSRSRVRFNERGGHSIWNPLTDDGDALRLAVKLGFTIETASMAHWGMNTYVTDARCKAKGLSGYGGEAHGPDPMVATRRAIVRAAAAMTKEG